MIFSFILIDKSGLQINISVKEPLKNGQKESSEELSEVKTTTGQNRIHPITVFPLKMIPFQPMI